MNEDNWLVDLLLTLRQAKNPAQVLEVIERLEDQYDSFSGPGQEMVDALLDEARRRLRGL